MTAIYVTGLYEYPIKSCAGNRLPSAFIDSKGITGDRRFMLVDESGNFLTQRKYPTMTLIKALIFPKKYIHIEAPDSNDLMIKYPYSGKTVTVSIWKDTCLAIDQGDKAAKWFKKFLGTECRLVYMPDRNIRNVDSRYAITSEDTVSFADGYPLLLLNEASLEDLNRRISEQGGNPVPADRFRPNIIIKGAEPYAEDYWRKIWINGIEFQIVKPCSRCAITTTNQQTAERGKEPLATLNTYRKTSNGKIMFCQNLIHNKNGIIHLGNNVEVLEEADHPNFELK